MLNGVFRLVLAGLIAFGIAFYVTDGDLGQARIAFDKAVEQSSTRKQARLAAASAEPEAAKDSDVAIAVVTRRSVARPLPSVLRMTGSTQSNRSVEVRAETSGMVASTTTMGAHVNEGDILCRLKVGDRAARREAAVARFRQAKVEEDAQARLSERGFAAANRASSARTSTEVIRAEIKQLDIEIRRLEIRAPFAGVIGSDPAQIGSILQVGSPCATIVDPDPLRVVGFAPEFRIGGLKIGAPGRATLATGEGVEGTIVFIAQTADPATRTFRVDLSVPNPSYALRDEVTAEIAIPLGTRSAHTLPQSALTLNDDGEIGVMIVEGGKAAFRKVSILQDNTDGVSLSGLGASAEVIVIGQEYVSEGTRVETTSSAVTALDSAS